MGDTHRYVILRHEGIEFPHYDLMFETSAGSALTTWRSDDWPIRQPTPLVRLTAHRRSYLTYEGPVSQNRGFVRQVEAGEFTVLAMNETAWRLRFPRTTLVFRPAQLSEADQALTPATTMIGNEIWIAEPVI